MAVDHTQVQDYAEAVRWFRMAAKHGYAEALGNPAMMYRHGLGVRRNYGEAATYYYRAAVRVLSVEFLRFQPALDLNAIGCCRLRIAPPNHARIRILNLMISIGYAPFGKLMTRNSEVRILSRYHEQTEDSGVGPPAPCRVGGFRFRAFTLRVGYPTGRHTERYGHPLPRGREGIQP